MSTGEIDKFPCRKYNDKSGLPEGTGDEMFVIEEELKKLPAQPGVYIMHDASDAIIFP